MKRILVTVGTICLLTAFGCWPASVGQAAAAPNVFGLDDAVTYDIYFGKEGDGLVLMNNVLVVGFREINNTKFVVIQFDSFQTKRTEGLILFDAIRAVVPTHRGISLQEVSRINS